MVESSESLAGESLAPGRPPAAVERLAYHLDDRFRVPGTKYRFGWDFILGLVPGLGDFVGLVLGLPIIAAAVRYRFPKMVILAMSVNVLFDAVLGTVPIAGNIFDFFWKAHHKNLRLLRDPKALSAIVEEAGWKLKVLTISLLFSVIALSALMFYIVRSVLRYLTPLLAPF
jgi:hypothetical protein